MSAPKRLTFHTLNAVVAPRAQSFSVTESQGPGAMFDGNETHAAIAHRWLTRVIGKRFVLKDGAQLCVILCTLRPVEGTATARVEQRRIREDGQREVIQADVQAVSLCRALEAHVPGWWHE